MKRNISKTAVFGLLLSLSLCVYCSSISTQTDFYQPITAELHSGNFNAVIDSLYSARENDKYKKKDRFLFYLDAGLAYHYAQETDSSNALLTRAENAADELYTKSISKAALSLVLNDNLMEYSGEDYEILYSNLIKALNYIKEDNFDDAFVEIRRANQKLVVLNQKYGDLADKYNKEIDPADRDIKLKYEAKNIRFNNDAFARYLSMHMYASEGLYDDADIDLNYMTEAFATQPHIYSFEQPTVRYRSAKGAVLSVIGLAGLAPVKEALNLRLRADKDLNLLQIFYTDPKLGETEYGHIPMKINTDLYYKFAIPQLVDRPSVISRIEVYLDSTYLGELKLIEDIGMVAKETFRAKSSLMYLKTIARSLAKAIVNYKAKKDADTGGLGGWLKKVAIDIGTDLTENADLRCSRLLPGKIYVGDFVIKPGVYDFRIVFRDLNNMVVTSTSITGYKVLENGLNMLEAVSLN